MQSQPIILSVRNVNQALPIALALINERGIDRASRNGDVRRAPLPFITHYQRPLERVLFDPIRDANPFFHLFESLWVLAGSCQVALPAMFNSRISNYSDDGVTLHGAYGHRLRYVQGFDQLLAVATLLKNTPGTRQAVVSIWDPMLDMCHPSTKDLPCNDMIVFEIDAGYLNMTVFNRSNDAIWGAYGANAVQFSFLQEYVVALVGGVSVGAYVQVSNNMHVYVDNPYWQQFTKLDTQGTSYSDFVLEHDHYSACGDIMKHVPLAVNEQDARMLYRDCAMLCHAAETGTLNNQTDPDLFRLHDADLSTYFKDVAMPALRTWLLWKHGAEQSAIESTTNIKADDWSRAMKEWMERRVLRRNEAAGPTAAYVDQGKDI